MAQLCFKHVFSIIIESMVIIHLAGFSSAIKSAVLNASISWAARANIKILCDVLIWEIGLTSMFLVVVVVVKLSPEADFHLVKGYRLQIAMQSYTKLTLSRIFQIQIPAACGKQTQSKPL